jgi:protein arginine kinase
MTANNAGTDPVLSQKQPWASNENSIWLASTITLYRNIEKFKFPGKLEADRYKQIIALISKGLLTNGVLEAPQFLAAEELTPLQKEFLVEHFLSQHNFQMAHSGEAFILDATGAFLALLNMRNHIQMHLIDSQGELEHAWNRLVEIETHLGRAVTYSFSPKYGFLTSDFNQCGTGLVVSVFLQVPAIVHSGTAEEILEKLADDSLVITGIQGNPTEIIGDVFVVQNNYTLGVTEENIISSLRAFTTKILVEENSRRKKIKAEESAEIKDRVSRAFGILIHSYQIEAVEALNAISLLKLGIDLGWVKGISLKEANNLFFNSRRAHLIHQHIGESTPEEILHKRAEYIHKTLKNVELVI